MVDVRTGAMDAERLGGSKMACAVFALHAEGKSIPDIMGITGLGRDEAVHAITSVWHEDKLALKRART